MAQHDFTVNELMDLLVEAVGLPEESRTAGSQTLLTDLGLDSLAFLELQGQLADRFGVVLPDESERGCTVGRVLDAVRTGSQAAAA